MTSILRVANPVSRVLQGSLSSYSSSVEVYRVLSARNTSKIICQRITPSNTFVTYAFLGKNIGQGFESDHHKSSHSMTEKNTESHDHDHSHSHSMLSHTHSHSHEDNVFIQEKGGLKNPAIRITAIGLAVNVAMAVSKGIGGVLFHSQALLADSIHAVSDLFSDFLTLATVSIASKPPSTEFPNGYGRVETLGSLGVSAILLLAGLSMGWSGLISMAHHLFEDVHWLDNLASFGHSHSHETTGDDSANLNAAWLALASIGIKEWLYFQTIKVAEQTSSNVLVANAWHHRIDSLVSMVAVATIGGGYFFHIDWLDPLGGLIVSSLIVRAGYSTAKQAALELADSNQSATTGGESSRLAKHEIRVQNALQNITLQHRQLSSFKLTGVQVMPSGPNIISTIRLGPKDGSKNIPLKDFQLAAELLKQQLIRDDRLLRKVEVTLDNDIKNSQL